MSVDKVYELLQLSISNDFEKMIEICPTNYRGKNWTIEDFKQFVYEHKDRLEQEKNRSAIRTQLITHILNMIAISDEYE